MAKFIITRHRQRESEHMKKLEEILGQELTGELKKASHEICVEAVHQEPPTGLISPDKKIAQLEAQTMDAFEKQTQEYIEGAESLMKAMKFIANKNPDIHLDKVAAELQNAGKKVNKASLDKLAEEMMTNQEVHPRELFMISEETVRALYLAAAHIMEEKHFLDAMKAFALICSIDPNVYNHWIGYGHSAFHSQNYDRAILAYYMATSLNPDSPWPLIWAANVCEQKNEFEAACDLLERAQVLSEEHLDKEIKALIPEISSRLHLVKGKVKK